MPDVSRHGRGAPIAGLEASECHAASKAPPEPDRAVQRVGWGFISLYASAYMGTILMLLAPVLVTLALKINSLVGSEEAPNSLALVTGIGSLLAMVSNPFFGKLSDRTT